MSTLEFALLLIPIVGNLAALILRKLGLERAADIVDAASPLALRLGKAGAERNKTEAIGAALDALAVAANELGPEHPVSKAEGEIRKHLRPSNPPPPVPPLPLLLLALCVGCVPLLGCAPSQLQIAASVANVAAETGGAAAPVLEARCVAPMKAAADAGDKVVARQVAEVCDPAVTAYEALRVAHVALRGAIVVAASGGDGAKIGALLGDVGAAAAQLTEAMMSIHGGAK
jgi:hypothetical protein